MHRASPYRQAGASPGEIFSLRAPSMAAAEGSSSPAWHGAALRPALFKMAALTCENNAGNIEAVMRPALLVASRGRVKREIMAIMRICTLEIIRKYGAEWHLARRAAPRAKNHERIARKNIKAICRSGMARGNRADAAWHAEIMKRIWHREPHQLISLLESRQ